MKTFKTPKGTELPLRDLHGQDYLDVKYRVLWFKEERPKWTIETELVCQTNDSATMKAYIKDDLGRVQGTGHSTETKTGFRDFLEKCETSAIGRALALVGYGTQFAAEMEEGKLADSPVSQGMEIGNANRPSVFTPKVVTSFEPKLPGDYVINVGKKYRGMKLKDVSDVEIKAYAQWLEKSAAETGKPLSRDALEFVKAAWSYLDGVAS